MTNILQTGVSGLLSYQAALATVSNNIANSSNENYTRQSSEFTALPSQGAGSIFIGSGVELSGVRRIYDQFLTRELFANTEAVGRLTAMTELGAQIDSVLINADSGVAAGIQGFFESLSSLSNDPASLAAREATLGDAQAAVDQFRALDERFVDLEQQINERLQIAVNDLNALAGALAQINDEIGRLSGSGTSPNDLLDRRDALLREMSNYTNVSTTPNPDGTINVLIGNGVSLVRGGETDRLAIGPDPFDSQRVVVTQDSGAGPVDISSQLDGGELGGLVEFRDTILTPARNELGRTAYALFDGLNQQQRLGLTLDGELGQDLFALGGPVALAANDASPGLTTSVEIADLSAVTDQEYELRFDGSAWLVRDAATGAPVSATGTGTDADPLVINGISVSVSGAAAGDRVLVRPAAEVIGELALVASRPADLALAAPVVGSTGLDNTGSGVLDGPVVLDATDSSLFDTVDITFVDETSYRIGSGSPVPYTSGEVISLNGYEFSISGSPNAGDTFRIESNTAGTGDNRNALRLLDVRTQKVLDGGISTVENAFDNMVTGLASANRGLNLSLDAQSSLLLNAEQERLALSGVNLDEEAAALLQFQQAYSASAEVVRIASELFDTLLGAVAN
jgi:flagellar hook-associated protein 1 FlgK